MTNTIVRGKVILIGNRINNFVFSNEVRLKMIIPQLEVKKLYKLTMYYKIDGKYLQSILSNIILYRDNTNLIRLFKHKKDGKYLIPCNDFLIRGESKKKIIIQELDKKLYNIHITSIHVDSTMPRKIYDVEKYIYRISSNKIDIHSEIEKAMKKWNYDIKNIISSEVEFTQETEIIQDLSCSQVEYIYVEVAIDSRKKLLLQIGEKVSQINKKVLLPLHSEFRKILKVSRSQGCPADYDD